MKKNHGRLLSMALSGAMVVSSLSMAVPMTALAANPTATISFGSGQSWVGGVEDAYVTVTGGAAVGDVLLTVSDEALEADDVETLTVSETISTSAISGGRLLGVIDFSTLTTLQASLSENSNVYVQAWDWDDDGDNTIADTELTLLGTNSDLFVYLDNIDNVTLTKDVNSVAPGQGKIKIDSTVNLRFEDASYAPSGTGSTMYYYVVSEATYNAYKDAVESGTGSAIAEAKVLSASTGTATPFTIADKGDGKLSTEKKAWTESAEITANATAITSASLEMGTYYVLASDVPLANKTSPAITGVLTDNYAATTFTLTEMDGLGFSVGTELDDTKKVISDEATPSVLNGGVTVTLGTDLQLYAYITDDATQGTYKLADSSKVTWTTDRQSIVDVTNGLVHPKDITGSDFKVTATYTPATGDKIIVPFKISQVKAPVVTITPAGTAMAPTTAAIGQKVKLTVADAATLGNDITDKVTFTIKDDKGNATDGANITNSTFIANEDGTYVVTATYTPVSGKTYEDSTIIEVTSGMTIKSADGTDQDDNPTVVKIDAINDVTKVTLKEGDSARLAAFVGNSNVTSSATWTSDDDDIATVSGGVVTAVGAGTANITVKSGDYTKKFIVTVNEIKATYAIGVSADEIGRGSVVAGNTLQLKVFKDGAEITDVSWAWTSSSTSAASVSSTGMVTGVAAGSSTIAARGVIDGKSVSFNYTLTVKANGLSMGYVDENGEIQNLQEVGTASGNLSKSDTIYIGNSLQLAGTYDATEVSGKWDLVSGSTDTATVTSKGLVTAGTTAGDVVVGFTYGDKTVYTKITVAAAGSQDLYFYDGAATMTTVTVGVGSSVGLKVLNAASGLTTSLVPAAGVHYMDVTDQATYTLSAGADEYFSVGKNTGIITGKKVKPAGVATTLQVTATYAGKTKTITVVVADEVEATAVKLDKTSLDLKIGDTATLVATIAPEGTTEKAVWASSDEKIATVADGTVKAIGEGTATVTVTAGNVSATCKVTVSKTSEEEEKEQKEKEAKEKAKQDAIDAASTAAAAATKDASDANIAALEKAIADAEAAGASDADVKAAKAALTTALKTAKTNADTAKNNAENAKANAEKAKADSDKKAADAATDAANQKKAADAAKAEAEKNQKALDAANAKIATSDTIAKLAGKTKKVSGNSYKTDADGGKSVTVTKAKNAKTVTFGKTVKISKNTYKVRSIKAKAFTGKKIRTVKINGANLLFVDNSAFTGTKATKITVTNAKNVKAQLKAAATTAGLKYTAKGNTVTITKK